MLKNFIISFFKINYFFLDGNIVSRLFTKSCLFQPYYRSGGNTILWSHLSLGIDAHKLISSPEKRFILYEASGHSPMNGEGEAFAADILDFVNTYK
jgi:hypothetical protein